MTIEGSGKVTYLYLNKIVLEGEINTTFNPNQVFIYLTALESKNLSLISFDKHEIYKKIFIVSMLDKQISTFYNMASFGLFSQERLEDSTVLEILGTDSNNILIEKNMNKKINSYYIDNSTP